MANRYGGSYRNGNGYGNFGPPPPQSQQPQIPQLSSSPGRQPPPQGGPQSVSPARQRLAPQQQDEYDPYGDGYSSSNGGGGGGGGGGQGGQGGGYMSSSSRGGGDRGDRDRRPPPRMGPGGGGGGGGGGRQMYQQADSEDEPYDQFDGRGPLPPSQRRPRQQPSQQNLQPQQQYGRGDRGDRDRGDRGDRGGGDRGYGSSQPERRQIGQDALDRIRTEWPAMCQTDCVPVQMALQLLDSSSVGRAHEYRAFQRTHQYLQDSLKGIVHDYHQGFNSSIGTFHKIQSSIQASQKKVRLLKEGLAASKTSLCKTDPELSKLYTASQQYDDLLQTLTDLDELRQVPERLEARISEKQFLTAVEVLQNALRKLRKPELDDIGALSDLRSYLANQETALMDILVEELHEHLYLKSPYCQERWQTLAKHQGAGSSSSGSTSSNTASGGAPGVTVLGATMGVTASASDTPANFVPFFALLDSMDVEHAVQEDPARNPEGDTFYYITLVVESLNKLGRLEAAVDQLKNRLPVELFSVVHETVNEIDQKHPSSLRGGSGAGAGSYLARGGGGGGSGGGANGDASNASGSGGAGAGAGGSSSSSAAASGAAAAANAGLHIYGSRETQMRADVIYDLLWTLYGKFEAIAEGHRIFHEYIKALIRREGAGNNSALLGSFKELWNLYQNEIRSLLHNYVTTDADLYRSGGLVGGDRSSLLLNGGGLGRNGSLGAGGSRENIFKFNEADAKSLEMATEYEALDGIIRAAVPGLTSNNGAGGGGSGGGGAGGSGGNSGANRGGRKGGDKKGGRKSYGATGSLDPMAQAGGAGGGGDFHKSLVEPSVFNMSLLLPPTLVFLQRLRGIVPPGSDLAASTLTSFLDNFLVNVFQPQLDETLGKLSDAVFGEADAFQIDPQWSQVARRPVFKGTTAFFSVVTAFCRMLGTIPHDQALSALIITQMMRYYDRCFSWYKALVTKTQVDSSSSGANDSSANASSSTGSDADTQRLRVSAVLALEDGDVANTVRALWAVDEELADAVDAGASSTATTSAVDDQVVLMHKKTALLQREVEQLLARYSGKSQRLGMSDVISDRDAITSLCLLYTSMKWLAVKIGGLRHIARPDGDVTGPGRGVGGNAGSGATGTSGSGSGALSKPDKRRWTLLNTESGKALADAGPVYLPMTQESVQSFDSIVSSYEELASTSLLTLHLEVRCRIAYALGVALSPEATAPYLLDQDVNEPDPQILSLNGELIAYDETVVRCLVRDREVDFVRQGLGRLVNAYLVGNAKMVTPMNSRGCGRMQLNILVLQQNLKNIEDGVDLARAANYYALFDKGPDAIVAKAKECKERQEAEAASADTSADGEAANSNDTFTYDELKELIELFYSEQLANPERGIENAARRQMGEKLMELGEHLWQM